MPVFGNNIEVDCLPVATAICPCFGKIPVLSSTTNDKFVSQEGFFPVLKEARAQKPGFTLLAEEPRNHDYL